MSKTPSPDRLLELVCILFLKDSQSDASIQSVTINVMLVAVIISTHEESRKINALLDEDADPSDVYFRTRYPTLRFENKQTDRKFALLVRGDAVIVFYVFPSDKETRSQILSTATIRSLVAELKILFDWLVEVA